MKNIITLLICLWAVQDGMTQSTGFFDFEYDEANGKIWLWVQQLDEEFLYVNGLAAGIGSNDIGLDRGQLGRERVVSFSKAGNKLLLTHINYDYRAVSDNVMERNSVKEAFAQSVLFGFTIEETIDGRYKIDLTPFLMEDAHGVSNRLARANQGSYKLNKSRSAIYMPRTKSFPDNTEFESILTFTGEPKGNYIRSVAPSAESITVRQHHSFVRLPDSDYEPRVFDPRSGYNSMQYADYATPIESSLVKRFIVRHRLKKKNPAAAQSEAVDPIVYYLDPGCPEPVRSALLEGARWWNQAFEAAGYTNAFQVKILPADADPMDVRYNLIQWVHRSTRGWSYGASVIDPRTGEIIKGHVSLGSLRVRQDFLIAQGLYPPYKTANADHQPLLQLALARLRQLSAHEVGHTIGLAHNFAASVKDRASVMDYPHPLIEWQTDAASFNQSYAVGIGDWDKRTVLYGYQDFSAGTDVQDALQKILTENEALGFQYISDRDARPQGGAHPSAHLWDNGSDPTAELSRILTIRQKAIDQFGLDNISAGTPLAQLENVFVPLYLAHRYQVEAVAKLIGGVHYSYAVKSDQPLPPVTAVTPSVQSNAMRALLQTITPQALAIDESILSLLPPQPIGYSRSRESFQSHTGLTFDPYAAAESAITHTLSMMLQPQRLARIVEHHLRDGQQASLDKYLVSIQSFIAQMDEQGGHLEIKRINQKVLMHLLMDLLQSTQATASVQAEALGTLTNMKRPNTTDTFQRWINQEINSFLNNPKEYKTPEAVSMPDGSPIGCGH